MNDHPGTSGTGRRLIRFGIFGLVSLALAMIATCAVVLWGLRGADDPEYTVLAPLQG